MRNIKLTIEYDGSRYSGWQRLGKGESDNTVENKLIEVIQKMTGEKAELFCGSRTEVGVHAYAQIANFKTKTDMKINEIKNYFNRYLPMDIAVTNVEEMPERFHASLNAKTKTYLYRIAIGDVPSVFDRKYTYYSFYTPDVELMRKAAKKLTGKHDFKDFSTVKRSKSTVKEIYSIEIIPDGKEIHVIIKANDFIHNMARMIASTILEIGLGKRKVEDIAEIFNPESEEAGSMTVSAQGLFLKEIEY
ncbi:tRNA pseudouridine(38-40) synthase TruA [Anaerobium acetethylicum]|uniref:tRNA pseudouridine synthase A n=1 Tax=Anaerobium acetethylicum TaxID=1619234 RepID=A0A1D3TZF7_9FIRM|nr:tRNA pseudouridine(38-40) synthase TruA [Anaerobium acetethylicum]SCP99952.1 tRNA pseudouridine38-40 synthase [Anaerobium acetethylicum]